MKSLWNDAEAAAYDGPLAQRVYTSRLLGRDHSLVLHGGGNTSVKIRERNLFRDDEDILYVKGSGWDLETIEPAGFAPVRLDRVLRLAQLERLSDPQMVQELRAAMTDPSAPTPSVETILHALLPYRFVDHTHADALLAITNTADGARRIDEIYGDDVVVVPYVMPGFDLARMVAARLSQTQPSTPGTMGLVLLNHGFFSFGETARESYERMLELVSRAEAYLEANHAWNVSAPDERTPQPIAREETAGGSSPQPIAREAGAGLSQVQALAGTNIAGVKQPLPIAATASAGLTPPSTVVGAHAAAPEPRTPMAAGADGARLEPLSPGARAEIVALRRQVSEAAGNPVILATHRDAHSLTFVRRPDLDVISQQGPATPDHVIRTKRLPQVGRDVAAFRKAYGQYFEEHARQSKQPLKMLDPAPRVILDPDLGMLTIGRTAQDAAIAFDVYKHTMDIVLRATALGGYKALPAQDIFAVEYWDLEQAKLRRTGSSPMFSGEIALVTGAASGIGKATVEAFLRRGAAVVGLDINPSVCDMCGERRDFLGVQCDVSNVEQIDEALNATVRSFGGLDKLVLNAGIFPSSRRIEGLGLADWRRVMDVNLDANLSLLSAAYPLLKCALRSGRVVVIGSKNVPAPGPGAAAYSASKAALNQLARVAALEWGADGIRVNIVHPNAVFDTGIWSDEVLQSRAANYGLSVEEYRKNNVLGVEVTSRDVAEMVAEMCGPLFAKTTAAQVPIDGGNERVI